MKIRVIIKRLSHPQVRWRLKVGLSIWAGAILLALGFKTVYDIGYFNAQALENDKNAKLVSITRAITPPVVNIESAQRMVSAALKEDPINPSTKVIQVIDSNYKLSSIIIENNNVKKVAWIIEMRLFFTGDLLNEEGYNLTSGVERQHNINNAGY